MSTDTTSKLDLSRGGVPGGVRFTPRLHPPDRLLGPPRVNYPANDGRAMSDNTIQERWIDRLVGGLEMVFRDRPDVFIASNLMWYPVKGNNRRRLAPDVMVVFGRSKKDRKSYVQHRERGLPPQVVFEILSPGNRKRAMDYKRTIYEKYGVEEYYVFDPYKIGLEIWLREGDAFRFVPEASGFVSPKLGVRFELADDMTVYAPDGRPIQDYLEVAIQRDEERLRADEERLRADEEHRQRVESEQRAERLAARLRALGLDPDE